MYCPRCGTQNDDNNFRCLQCGTVIQQQGPMPSWGGSQAAMYPEPSKADLALILSIVGWVVCALVGIVGVIIAKGEMTAIEEGRRDPSKLSTAKIAFWIGMIQIILFGLGVVGFTVLMVVAGA